MRTTIETRARACAIFIGVAALAAASCAKVSGGASSPSADDNGGVTSAAPANGEGAALAPSDVSNVATQRAVVPVAPAPAAAPAPAEAPASQPSAAVMGAVAAEQRKLDALTAVLEGTKVRFVDCDDAAACTARLEAHSLAGLRDLLQSVSAQQGGVGFVVREQLDAYSGRTFVADVTLGAAAPRAVPTDENELLAN